MLLNHIVVLEKTLESPLDSKEIKQVTPKGNQPWIFLRRTDAEPEAPILCPHDLRSWLTGKDPDAGKDWRQEEKGTAEDEMVGWHHWLIGHEFEQALRVGDGQGSLVYCSPWGHQLTWLSDWTELNWGNHESLLPSSVKSNVMHMKAIFVSANWLILLKNKTIFYSIFL